MTRLAAVFHITGCPGPLFLRVGQTKVDPGLPIGQPTFFYKMYF